MANFIDLTGKRFNLLTVISLHSKGKTTYWNCKCDCGNEKSIKADHLKSGLIKSCGHLRNEHSVNFENLIGQRFSKLKVLSLHPRGTTKVTKWNCICDCGAERIVAASDLKSGATKSCGCILNDAAIKYEKTIGEIWKTIPNYEGLYEASNLGRIRSLSRCKLDRYGKEQKIPERILKYTTNKGYYQCSLSKNGQKETFQIHGLIGLCFLGTSELQIDHIDNIKENNRADNLQFLAPRPNSHKRIFKIKTSKYLGVYKSNNKWRSVIYVNGKNRHLGYFDNEENAHAAFLEALRLIQ